MMCPPVPLERLGRARTPLRAEDPRRESHARIPFHAGAATGSRRGAESALRLPLCPTRTPGCDSLPQPAAALRRVAAFAAFLAALFLAPFAAAHPVHTSHADADFHPATHRLEISLRVIAGDLLAALQTEAGAGAAELSWEKTPPAELDRRIRAYVEPRFRFLDRDGRETALRWVGRDGDRADGEQRVWLYLEVDLPGGLDGASVQHTLLFERVPEQRNTVRIRQGDRSITLSFSPGQGPRPIVLPR